MRKLEKAKIIVAIVFHSVWLALTAFLYGFGMMYFLQQNKAFEDWMVWGLACSFVIIPFIIRLTWDSTKDGEREGARTYTVTVSDDTVTVTNHPFKHAVLGAVVGLFFGIAIGPIVTPVIAIRTVIKLIGCIKDLRAGV